MGGLVGTEAIDTSMNQKNLNYEIETLTGAMLSRVRGSMNQKNLNYEIETLLLGSES